MIETLDAPRCRSYHARPVTPRSPEPGPAVLSRAASRRVHRVRAAWFILAVLAIPFSACARRAERSPAVRAVPSAPATLAFSVPDDSLIPADAVGRAIRRGRAILLATRDSLPHNVGNSLRCVSCHLDSGTRVSSGAWVGVYSSFPQYNKRGGRVFRIEDRINECLRRSLAGTPLPLDSRDMSDLVATFAFLSRGVPQGVKAEWLGIKRLTPRSPRPDSGAALYASECARCHGPAGEGTVIAPAVWGSRSFAIGAGMARLHTVAAFVRWNMPFDRPGSLDDQQAYDVASFVLAHSRPDTPGKERDYPNGDAPDDNPYAVTSRPRVASKTAAH